MKRGTVSSYEPSTPAMRPVIELAERLHRWRWITPSRRAEMILLLDEVATAILREAERDHERSEG